VLQVAAAHRTPDLEIYCQVRNRFGPPEEQMRPADAHGAYTQHHASRHQDVFLQFDLVNIGGVRAEAVSLKLDRDFSYRGKISKLSDRRVFRGSEIPQFAPAQVLPLFRFDYQDLFVVGADGRSADPRSDIFTITISYNGPRKGVNRLLRWFSNFRSKKQFESRFSFVPENYVGIDLPPEEYAG
jgi:hypothetical protein